MNRLNPYKQASVTTATPGRLLVMLYDGLLRFMNQAVRELKGSQHEAAHHSLKRAQDIVLELRSTLEHDRAPELCESLDALYSYWYIQLVEANRQKSDEPIAGIVGSIKEIRDAYEEVARQVVIEG